MRMLDIYCGAGGAARGYHKAGFESIVGVDIVFQKRYPYHFVQGDALEVLELLLGGSAIFDTQGKEYFLSDFDAIHGSPPCHEYSTGTKHRKNAGVVYPDLLPPTREFLLRTHKPYIIENVPGAQKIMRDPVMLCGGMFGLGVKRHRFFESNFLINPPEHTCNKDKIDADEVSVTRHGPPPRWYRKNPGKKFNIKTWHEAMGIDWMNRFQLTQAIPPAYTEFIGRQLINYLNSGKAILAVESPFCIYKV